MKISNPVTCEHLLRPKMNFKREEIWCVALSPQCELLKYKRLGLGGRSSVNLQLRKLLKFSLDTDASQLILLHTHTGEYSFPSDEDLYWTEKIKKLLDIVDLKLSDHIIISKKNFTSLLQHDPKIFEE